MDDPLEALELERALDWRIRKLGKTCRRVSAAAAKLLQKLAEEVRGLARFAGLHRVSGDFELARRVRCHGRFRRARPRLPRPHRHRALSAGRRGLSPRADRPGEGYRRRLDPSR